MVATMAPSDTILDPRLTARREPAFRQVPGAFVAPEVKGGSVTSFLQRAGLDYEVASAPISYARPVTVSTAEGTTTTTEYVPIQGQKILLAPDRAHPDRMRELGIVAHNYPVLQNRDLARILDPLTAEWTVDTLGEYGDMVYFALNAGKVSLFPGLDREDYQLYMTLMEWRAKGKALSLMATPVRLWCGNQQNVAIRDAVLSIKIPHIGGGGDDGAGNGNFRQDVEWYSAIIAAGLEVNEATLDALRALRDIPIPTDHARRVAEAMYVDPSMPRDMRLVRDFTRAGRGVPDDLRDRARDAEQKWEQARQNVNERRDAVINLYDLFSQENPDLAGTGYALYQAAVEHLDYSGGRMARESAAFGKRADLKLVAYKAITRPEAN